MSVRKAVTDRVQIYTGFQPSSMGKWLSRLFGKVSVKVLVNDAGESFFIVLDHGGLSVVDCGSLKPQVVVEGKTDVLIDLLNNLSRERYLKAERRGDIKVDSKGFKGRLVVSKVRKLLGV